MTAFLNEIGLVVNAAMGWLIQLLDVVVASPALITLCIALPITFKAVDTFQRLIKL